MNSKLKDLMVKWLIKQISVDINFPSAKMANEFELQDIVVRLFLKQLDKKGLIKYSELGAGYVTCYPTLDLYDFHNMGGYTIIEEGLLKNIEKLDLELQQLKFKFPENVEMFANATSILSVVLCSAATAFSYLR